METPKKTVTILKKESYLAMIHNAVGTNLFRNLYALVNGEKNDIVKDGVRSCALFVSSILNQFHFIDSTIAPHAGIAGLEKNMKNSGWRITDTPQPGDIIFWEPKLQADATNSHIGFFIGNDQAISNDWQTRMPIKHHMTYGTNEDGTPVRAITAIYTRDFDTE
jgi:NlpC/P60 family